MSDPATGLVKWWDSMESGADNNPSLVRRYHNSMAGGGRQRLHGPRLPGHGRSGRPPGPARRRRAFRERARGLGGRGQCAPSGTPGPAFTRAMIASSERASPAITYSGLVPLWAGLASPDRARPDRSSATSSSPGGSGRRTASAPWPPTSRSTTTRTSSSPTRTGRGRSGRTPTGWSCTPFSAPDTPREALAIAERVTRLCLDDLDRNGMMHENYHAETGAPLAAPDFISWNLLVAQMIEEAGDGSRSSPIPERTLWPD